MLAAQVTWGGNSYRWDTLKILERQMGPALRAPWETYVTCVCLCRCLAAGKCFVMTSRAIDESTVASTVLV